ncbi:hypothetical protein, partial [Nonomuraea longicatena]|uniref:hypothetical protein n=1 Tax=Nonomuraea longicatena TaxID=83682 RepID=UPI0031DD41FB
AETTGQPPTLVIYRKPGELAVTVGVGRRSGTYLVNVADAGNGRELNTLVSQATPQHAARLVAQAASRRS